MTRVEEIRTKSVQELCKWLRETSGLQPTKVGAAIAVIVKHSIDGDNFFNCTMAKWEELGLPWGVADSLVRIAQRVVMNSYSSPSSFTKKEKQGPQVVFSSESPEKKKPKLCARETSANSSVDADSFETIQMVVSGLNFSQPKTILNRPSLIDRMYEGINTQRHFLLHAPPAMGKTSAAQLLRIRNEKSADAAKLHWIGCAEIPRANCYTALKEIGIDLAARQTTLTSKTIVVLDDCDAWFGQEEFWTSLMKSTDEWCPQQVRFLLIATRLLSIPIPSPDLFTHVCRLSREDFLLSKEESLGLIKRMDSEFSDIVHRVIAVECAGVVGLITLSLGLLHMKFRHSERRNASDGAVLRHFFSQRFTSCISRCFPFKLQRPEVDNNTKSALKKAFTSAQPVLVYGYVTALEDIRTLQDLGVIVSPAKSRLAFSSLYAKRYMIDLIFYRSIKEPPSSVEELVIRAVSRMSSSSLSSCIVHQDGDDFVKEAALQDLFVLELVAETPPNFSICSELGRRLPDNANDKAQTILPGEIDILIDDGGDVCWGIELLVGTDRVGEHLARFRRNGGQYAALEIRDYVVVDFRRATEGPMTVPEYPRHGDKRMTVIVSPDNYENCQVVIVGQEEETKVVSLKLR